MERTALPFVSSVVLVAINAAGDMKEDIQTSSDINEWKFASWVSSVPQKIEIKIDSAIITTIDSVYVREFSSEYIFVKQNNKWYFKTYKIKQLPFEVTPKTKD